MSGGGSSGKNYYGFGKGKGGRKGDPIIWEGPLGPDSFPEPMFEFPPQHKSDLSLQIKIFDLECKVNHYEELSEGNKDDEDDDASNAAASQDEPCTIPYCNCPCHKKKAMRLRHHRLHHLQ